ncbi:MAG: hypothetical protein HQL22_08435 [Candidatus Omnitrophica bacterium]|nr:hypothetical protein [Candidatus Omnitrophota bacterium]
MTGKLNFGFEQEQLVAAIANVGYDIIDEVISPAAGLEQGSVWADLYLAGPELYLL